MCHIICETHHMKRKINNENSTVYLLQQVFNTVSCMNYLHSHSQHKPLLNG